MMVLSGNSVDFVEPLEGDGSRTPIYERLAGLGPSRFQPARFRGLSV